MENYSVNISINTIIRLPFVNYYREYEITDSGDSDLIEMLGDSGYIKSKGKTGVTHIQAVAKSVSGIQSIPVDCEIVILDRV